jgi:TRAP-type C4-dicarboxylate transport system permease small subunit
MASACGWIGRFLGALSIALMTGLITADVVGRYLLGMPTYVATEFSGYLCVVITFVGLSYVSRMGRQIEVTILIDRLPARLRRILKLCTHSAALFFVCYFAYETLTPTVFDFRLGTRSLTFVHTPLWVVNGFVPLGLTMLAVEMMAQWLRMILGGKEKKEPDELKVSDF